MGGIGVYIVFTLLFLASAGAVVLGLINPRIVMKGSDDSQKKRGKVLLRYGIPMVVLFILVGVTAPDSAIDEKSTKSVSEKNKDVKEESKEEDVENNSTTEEEEEATEAVNLADVDWNTENTDASKNGNLQEAYVPLIRMNMNDIQNQAIDLPSNAVNKAPWKYYGQLVRFSGEVGIVEEYPSGSDMSKAIADGGEAGQIVLTTDDGTVVDFFVIGTTGIIVEGDYIDIIGLPIGSVQVENQLGGTTTQLAVVGKIQD